MLGNPFVAAPTWFVVAVPVAVSDVIWFGDAGSGCSNRLPGVPGVTLFGGTVLWTGATADPLLLPPPVTGAAMVLVLKNNPATKDTQKIVVFINDFEVK